MRNERNEVLVDCEAGRRLGCCTFCCRLLVRLAPDERSDVDPSSGIVKGYLDKSADGLCVHFDPSTQRCAAWDTRPEVCREYDCNADPLLQVVLRDGFADLTTLVSTRCDIPRAHWHRIPLVDPENDR